MTKKELDKYVFWFQQILDELQKNDVEYCLSLDLAHSITKIILESDKKRKRT